MPREIACALAAWQKGTTSDLADLAGSKTWYLAAGI